MLRFKREYPVLHWVLTRIGFILSVTAMLVLGVGAVVSMCLIFITAAYNDQWVYFLILTPVLFFASYCFLELSIFMHDLF